MRPPLTVQHRYPGGAVIGRWAALFLLAASTSFGAPVFAPGESFPSAGRPAKMVAADFDGDTDIAIAIARRYADTVYIHLNDGSGDFTEIMKFEAARDGGLAAADFNNDGYYDLVLYDEGWLYEEWGTTVYLNNGDATFGISFRDTTGSPEFAAADFDGDDFADIVVYCYLWDNPGIWIFRGLGDGTFDDPVVVDPAGTGNPLVGDIDNDGDVDLLYEVGSDAVCRLNNGDGTFADPISTGTGSNMGTLTELNGDQYPDLMRRQILGCSGYAVCLIGYGDGTFAPPHKAWTTTGLLSGIALAAADFSHDGYPDIALFAPENSWVQVGFNDGRLDFDNFSEEVATTAGGLHLATGDFDSDGDIDLAALAQDSMLTVAMSLGAQHPRTHTVPTDYATVQEAIDAAWNLDTIFVCPGINVGPIDFGGKNLVLISSDCTKGIAAPGDPADWRSRAEVTVLDGGGTGRVLTFDDFEDDRSVVSGFTIQNGYATGLGGGIYCYDTAAPTIINNVIRDNHATTAGGGIFVHTGPALIANNLIVNNSSDNWGGGIYAGAATICLNTVYGNSTVNGGGGLYYNYGDPTITSNIFWGNSSTTGGDEIHYLTNPPVITYSDVQGGWAGEGNMDTDPMFVDPAGFDFNLQEESPCVDAGDPGLPLDPDGSPADIGAYYYAQPLDVEDDAAEGLPNQFALLQNYPNPFNPATTIEYSLPRRSHATIRIFNLIGQRVATLVDREVSAGSHAVTWNGTDANGTAVATGLYLYRLEAGDHVRTKKMLLLK